MQPIIAAVPGWEGVLLLLWRIPMLAARCTLLRDSLCIATADADCDADTTAVQYGSVWWVLRDLPAVYSGHRLSRNCVSARQLPNRYLRHVSVRARPNRATHADSDANTSCAMQQRPVRWFMRHLSPMYSRSEYGLPRLRVEGSVPSRCSGWLPMHSGSTRNAHADTDSEPMRQRGMRWSLHHPVLPTDDAVPQPAWALRTEHRRQLRLCTRRRQSDTHALRTLFAARAHLLSVPESRAGVLRFRVGGGDTCLSGWLSNVSGCRV